MNNFLGVEKTGNEVGDFKEDENKKFLNEFNRLNAASDLSDEDAFFELDELPYFDSDKHESYKEKSDNNPSPKRHELLLREPTETTTVSESTKGHSMFDGELKGFYATADVSETLKSQRNLQEIRDFLSSSDKDGNPLSFILAYRDQDSLITQVVFSDDEHSEKIAVGHASDFFERNCGYKDFTARWLTDYCTTSAYAHDLVRVITATNVRTEEREVIYISKNVGVIRYNNLSNPNDSECSSGDDLYEERPISSLADIECIITGLTLIGYLSFGSKELEARNTTIEKSAKVMAIRISDTTDSTAGIEGVYSFDDEDDNEDIESKSVSYVIDGVVSKYISGISSNDPSHTKIWYSSTGEEMDYSTFSHKQRWNKVSKSIKNTDVDLPPPAIAISERVWVYGSMTKSSYYRLYDKRHLSAETLRHSLLFSEEFLKLFISISNKQGGLAIRRITGAKDAYHIFLNCKKVLLEGLFRPKNIFELDISHESDYWDSGFSVIDAIIEGWSNEAICYENWNDMTHEYDSMQGSYKQVLSHWLFTLIASLYFDSSAVKKPRTLRPTAALHSLGLNNISVFSKGLGLSRSMENNYGFTNPSVTELADSQFLEFKLGCAQICIGYSLFEITVSKNGLENTYSFFLSSDNNGLIISDNGDASITVVVSNEADVVQTVWCVKDVGYAIDIAKAAIVSSDLAKSKGLDVYDAMREIDKTANSYGVDLKASFRL